jgi:hypothetical protein
VIEFEILMPSVVVNRKAQAAARSVETTAPGVNDGLGMVRSAAPPGEAPSATESAPCQPGAASEASVIAATSTMGPRRFIAAIRAWPMRDEYGVHAAAG